MSRRFAWVRAISSLPSTQYIWKNVRGLATSTSSTGLEANDDRLRTGPLTAGRTALQSGQRLRAGYCCPVATTGSAVVTRELINT
jgi:hypothetical protein